MRYFLCFLLYISVTVSGQNLTFKGTIKDAETGEPLAFANVVVNGLYKGTVSNSEGVFVLNSEGIRMSDTLIFSYLGYEPLRITADKLLQTDIVNLKQKAVGLDEVRVLSKKLSAEEIVEKVEENYSSNYEVYSDRQRFFYHKFEKVPFAKENQLVLKKSDFPGINRKTFDELFRKLPKEFNTYQDAIVDLYRQKGEEKLVPVKALSMEENGTRQVVREIETKLGDFITDIEKSTASPDIYYKIRTGILSHKFNYNSDYQDDWKEYRNDTLNYTVPTGIVKGEILFMLSDYADIESDNWEFVTKRKKYIYKLEDMVLLNEEPVYKVKFTPDRKGLFEGTMYVSTSDYAVLQVDFAFARGKKDEEIQLFGFGHAMNYKEARVIFEKGRKGYFVKYLHVRQNESASVDRNFSVVKKEKRFLFDKELNEMKLDAVLSFIMETDWELLVLDREEIGTEEFQKAVQPRTMKFKKEYVYSPEMWGANTVLVPTSELRKYKRK